MTPAESLKILTAFVEAGEKDGNFGRSNHPFGNGAKLTISRGDEFRIIDGLTARDIDLFISSRSVPAALRVLVREQKRVNEFVLTLIETLELNGGEANYCGAIAKRLLTLTAALTEGERA